MARKGALTAKTYFPNNGDVLEDHKGGTVWECARTNTYITNGGVKVKYGLLIGKCADLGDTVIPLPFHSLNGDSGLPILQDIDVIKRGEKVYKKNPETGTWQEEE